MIKSSVKLIVESCSDSVYGVFENVIGVTAQSPCEYLNKYLNSMRYRVPSIFFIYQLYIATNSMIVLYST